MSEVVILVFLTMASDDAAVQKDTKALEGSWEFVAAEMKGQPAPRNAVPFQAVVFADVEAFAKQKDIKGSGVLKVRLDPSVSPKTIRATGKSPDGKGVEELAGVYEVDGDKLKLCLGPADQAPTALKTTAEDQGKFILVEFKRVKKLPKESDGVEEAKINRERLTVRILTTAVETYRVRHDEFPEKLDDIAAYLEGGKEALKDVWGQPYKYDPNGPKNGGKKPDIWSEGPPGQKQPIGNWPEEDKDKKPKEGGKPNKK